MGNPLTQLFPDDDSTQTPDTASAIIQQPTTPQNIFSELYPDDTPDNAQNPADIIEEAPQQLNTIGRMAQYVQNVVSIPFMGQEDRKRVSDTIDSNRNQSRIILKEKASNFFTGIGSFATAISQDPNRAISGVLTGTKNIVGEQVKHFKDDPAGAFDSLLAGFVVDPIMDALTTITGVKLDDPQGLRAANPEERAQATVSTIANGVAFAVAKGAHTGTEALMLRGQRKLLAGATTEEALIAAEALPKGVPGSVSTQALIKAGQETGFFVKNELVRNATQNVSSGYAAGLAYGMIQGAGAEDQASQMLASGLLFAGFGTVATLIQGGVGVFSQPKNVPLELSKLSRQLANYRQFKQTAGDLLPNTLERVQLLADSPSINVAVARLHKPEEVSLLRGLSREELELVKNEMIGPEHRETRGTPLSVDEELELDTLRQERASLITEAENTPFGVPINNELSQKMIEVGERIKGLEYQQNMVGLSTVSWPHEKGQVIARITKTERAVFDTKMQNLQRELEQLQVERIKFKVLKDAEIPHEEVMRRVGIVERVDDIRAKINLLKEDPIPTEYDVLLVGNDAASNFPVESFNQFRGTGFMTDQMVSYRGENYRIADVLEGTRYGEEFKEVLLRRLDSPKSVKVSVNEISDVPLADNFGVGAKDMRMNYSLKAQILAELQSSTGQRISSASRTAGEIWKKNREELRIARTGRPITLIGFRGERGEPISGTGRFYSADLSGAMSYALMGKKPGGGIGHVLKVHQLDFKKPYVVNGGHRTLVSELVESWINENLKVENIDPKRVMEWDANKLAAPSETWADNLQSYKESRASVHFKDTLERTNQDVVKITLKDGKIVEVWRDGFAKSILPREYRALLEASEVRRRSGTEAGYQLQDKLIRSILEEQGHDGLIYNKVNAQKGTTWNETVEIVDFQGIARRDVTPEIRTVQFPEPRLNAITNRLFDDFRDIILGRKADNATKAPKLKPEELARLTELEDRLKQRIELTGDEAREIYKLRSMKEVIPDVKRTVYTELDRARDKVSELEAIKRSGTGIGNVDIELIYWRKYAKDLADGKAENPILHQTKRSLKEVGDVLENGKSFHQSVVDFATERGMESEVTALKQEFAKRFAQELTDNMDGADATVYKKAISEFGNELDKKALANRVTLSSVIDVAGRAGMYMDRVEGGGVIIRDVNTNKRITQAKNLAEAKDFIVKSGTEKGIEFDGGDGGGPIPPWALSGGMATPRGPLPPNQSPYDPGPVTKIQELAAIAGVTGKVFAGNNKLFLDHDIMYSGQTRFFNDVFMTVQDGYDKFTFNMRQAEPRLIKIQNMARTLDAERRAQIGEAIETMSPDEVVNLYFKNRQLTPDEINLGTWLAENNVDIKEVYDFIAARREATEGMKVTSAEYQNEMLRLKLESGLFENPIMGEAIARVDALKGDNGAALRLARSKMARDGKGELSRSDYMKDADFGPAEKALLKEIENAYNDLETTFNIPDAQRLNHFMAHIRLYEEGMFVPSTVREFSTGFGNVNTDFYARMARTGEIDVYERDPVVALVRYARAGIKANHLMPSLNAAVKTAESILKTLPNDGRKASVQSSLVRFFDDVRNVTPKFDRIINGVLDKFLNEQLGMRVDARRIANAISLIGETAAQGAKPLAGVRDFIGNVSVMFTEFGANKTRKFLQYGLLGAETRGKFETQRSLIDVGVVPERSALVLENPVERGARLDPSAAVRGSNRIAEIGVDVSLQPAAYRFAHTGVYLTFLKDSDATLSRLNKRQLSKAEAYKEVGLNNFELPIRQEYDRLVSSGKFDEASVYIAKIAQAQVVGKFGQSNGLHYSGNIAGRIFGQFGTWSAFQARNIGRQITTGTISERAAKIARASAMMYGVSKVSDATGLDLGNWYIFPGASFFDDNAPLVPVGPNVISPGVESARTVWDALTGRGMRKNEAMRKLRQTLPLDPKTGEWNVPHLYIPFSYQIDAMINSYHSLKAGKLTQGLFESTGGRTPRKQSGYGGF